MIFSRPLTSDILYPLSALSSSHLLLIILAAERGIEMVISRLNGIHIKKLGGEEYGAAFTKLLIGFHVCWFFSFGLEAEARHPKLLISPASLVSVFLLFQAWRYWCILSLGRFWNTRILVIPGTVLINAGPYRFFKHPNYALVLLEIFAYPALFGCWITALIFGFSNILVLKKRIGQEEAALGRRDTGLRIE